jgi:glutathione peroxidase
MLRTLEAASTALALGWIVFLLAATGWAEQADGAAPSSPLQGEMKALDGRPVDLSQYRGKVVLIVNVASYCGNTPQYADLEALYQQYGHQGLVVLGFPANEFGRQEPGTDQEIAAFCEKKYGVTFPMSW